MASNILICDNLGNPKDDITATAIRSWLINGIGKCTFEMATNDPKCTETNLRFGNIVYVTDNYLDTWIGVIVAPRMWKKKKVVVTAVSAEKILDWRFSTTTSEYTLLRGKTAGQNFRMLLDTANAQGGLQIQPGSIYDGGEARTDVINESIYSHLIEWAEDTGYSWDVTATRNDNGRIILSANWYQWQGEDTGLELNNDNTEWSQSPLTEQGEIWNDVIGYGDSAVQNERIDDRQSDVDSISLYGLRQHVHVFTDNIEGGSIKQGINEIIRQKSAIRSTLDLNAVNVNNLFYKLRKGNIFTVNLAGVGGFRDDGQIGIYKKMRLLGLEYIQNKKKVRLIVEDFYGFPA